MNKQIAFSLVAGNCLEFLPTLWNSPLHLCCDTPQLVADLYQDHEVEQARRDLRRLAQGDPPESWERYLPTPVEIDRICMHVELVIAKTDENQRNSVQLHREECWTRNRHRWTKWRWAYIVSDLPLIRSPCHSNREEIIAAGRLFAAENDQRHQSLR